MTREGSGNPGALNAGSVLGRGWGYAVLAADGVKGVAASVIGRRVAGDDGAYVAGAAAVAGHAYPLGKRFRGGKGVATSVGTAFVCMPLYAPLDVGIAWATYMAAARARHDAGHIDAGLPAWAGTFAASAIFIVTAVVTWRARWRALWAPQPSVLLPAYALVATAIILVKFLTARPPDHE